MAENKLISRQYSFFLSYWNNQSSHIMETQLESLAWMVLLFYVEQKKKKNGVETT